MHGRVQHRRPWFGSWRETSCPAGSTSRRVSMSWLWTASGGNKRCWACAINQSFCLFIIPSHMLRDARRPAGTERQPRRKPSSTPRRVAFQHSSQKPEKKQSSRNSSGHGALGFGTWTMIGVAGADSGRTRERSNRPARDPRRECARQISAPVAPTSSEPEP